MFLVVGVTLLFVNSGDDELPGKTPTGRDS